jgi:hypothetical protein
MTTGGLGENEHSWWLQRPRGRRAAAIAASAFYTAVPAFIVVGATWAFVSMFQDGEPGQTMPALQRLGGSIEESALAFDGIMIGVLASLLIAQVIARKPRLRSDQQIRRYGSVAMFSHLLASLPVAVAVLTMIGALGNADRSNRMWVVVVAALVAVGVAQWIESYWSRNRRLARNHSRIEIAVNARELHRIGAVVSTNFNTRRTPWRKLALHVLSACVVATLVGTIFGAFTIGLIDQEALSPAVVGELGLGLFISQAWTVPLLLLAAALQSRRLSAKDKPWGIGSSACVVIALGLPALALTHLSTASSPLVTPVSLALLLAISAPFITLIAPRRSPASLAMRVLAVRFQSRRRKRVQLLRDLYVCEWNRKKKARLGHVARSALRQNRPEVGIGSSDWLLAHGRSPEVCPLVSSRSQSSANPVGEQTEARGTE